ncbi:proto-oncogene tyrosine-protein kinase ROS [Chrysoperla carnea]|uniref:proto-oncogene tyrosine-protein kinase ROS n=1 Tax=Chrysoperla carnea TaxID=189513 RepID=UPI001D078297|nr:proto-oncogene tyrosine-protein kinase ROS [Chrysoperla carnea]
MKLIIYLCLCIFGGFCSILSTSSVPPLDFQEQCILGCPFQNNTDATSHFVGDVEQCTSGCKLWRSALDSSCKAVCNGTQDWLPPKQLYCVIGCNDAVSRYLNQLRSELGTLPAPALVADTLKATSLSLEWSWNLHPVTQQSHIKYLVQWRYEELAAAWQYCRNQTWSSKHDTVFVDNLQPYTKYRFRVAVLLWPNNADELVVSEPSVVISTLPLGVPSSAPIIVRAVAVDSSRISISWEPGPFPNGPILSYVLQIVSQDHHPVLKDVPAQNNTDFYMFKHLQSSRNYTVSVSMRNSFGQGPAASVTLATPSEYIVNQTVPVLILGADHTVIQQSADMLEEPIILYKSIKLIKGVAIHVNYKLLFISDSDGYVWRIPLQNQYRIKSRTAILKPDTINYSLPLDLSVDWLNDQIYILEQITHARKSRMWQITRCSLDGSSRVVAMAGFVTKPHHIEVDPYNGYLFWVNNIGLWRLDLADSSNGIRREISPLQLLFEPNLGAFTVDHTNFRLLVPHQQKNTVLSVSLDGREIIDLRSNTQSPMFNNVTSIATANGLFYWTNGDEVIAEEYNKATDSYFHNTFPEFDLIDRSFISLCVNLPTSQPIPVPINPPTSVQAILGSTKAKVSWQIPHLLGGQGKGAWQNWSYELQIMDINNNKIHNQPNINATTFTINNLKENTEYIFKTAAYTRSGRGPWSSEFRGRTLNTSSNVKFVWSAKEGLLWSDVTGDSVHILLHKTNEYHVTDITWFNNILYMATNTTRVYQYDLNSERLDQMNEIDSASSIAVDWIGKKLYWSNPKQQLITRGNLNGGQHEPLPIVTLARELNIDSINAYLYWSNGHSVECARLNGAERRPYYSGQLFSGKQVMGLTIDIDQHIVYWIVRSFEGSTLFHAPTAEQLSPTSEITMIYRQHHLQQNDIQGPLCFFSQRLLWLQDPNKTIIGDLNGQNTAILSGTRLNGLKMVTVKDDTLHVYPSNLNKLNINVIPRTVDATLIKIEGPFNRFNITWSPVNNVNYGQVFYEIKAGNLYPDTSISTTENSILYWQELPPYSELKVTIRAFTYWGSATPARANLRSPPSTPSKPENVRLFVEFENRPFFKKNKIAIFRWSEPKHTNGVIQGYFIDCWYEDINGEKIKVYENYQVPSVQYEFTTKLLLDNFTYFFQVVAYTEMGTGDPSDIISGDMNTEIYIPKLLAASEDTIFIKDFDSNTSVIAAKSNGKIIDIAYLYNERKVIWLNDLQEIFISNLDRTNRTKLVTLNNTGVSITVDWIQRCLYWVQFNQQTHQSTIYSFDLNTINDDILTIRKLVTRSTKIHHLEASPLSSTLYWTESSYNDDHTNIIKTCNYNGDNIETFFSNEPGNLCNCTQFMQIDRSFTLTMNEQNDIHLLFINRKRQLIIDADFLGCYCKIIQSNTINDYTKSLTATNDNDHIYYVNSGKIYTNYNQLETNFETIEIIKTFGSYKQLFPNEYCLIPYQSTSLEVTMYNRSAHSLILKMPKPEQNGMDTLECSSTMPSIQYRILYRQYNKNDPLKCNKYSDIILTYDNYLKVHDLKPFTKYIFCLVVSNYYSALADKTLVIGTGVVLQTAAGAPSKAENVTVSVLNPTSIKVNWDPPIEINDETVSYEVHWRTEEAIGNRQKGELETMYERQAVLQKLLQNHMYSIWIRTYSPNSETYTDSELIQIETYPEPTNIILRNITAYSISFIWEKSANITNHMIKYTKVGMNSWTILPSTSIVNVSDNVYFYMVTQLQPKTLYEFQLLLSYINFNETYVWPTDGRFKFQTLGDKPSAPGVPIIEHVRGDVYRIVWEMSNDNGSPIREYRLEGHTDSSTQIIFPEKLLDRKRRNSNLTLNFDDELPNKLLNKDESPENFSRLESSEPYIDEDEIEINWEVYYNGSENYWLITDLIPHQKYWFRVCAYNEYGWGPYSDVSEEFEAGTEASGARLAHRSQQFTILMAIIVPILVAVCMLTFCSLFCICKRRKKDSKLPAAVTPITTLGPDVELAILRDMPRGRPGGTFVHSTNILYTSSDLPLGDSPESLPHIKRDQITLTKFLGSGAFGEVFEGKAKCLDGIAGETRVAVKTLRKGASPQERSEFLREAQLMAHFKHKHILRLLGVCRDNDPHFIIMELMQAGDLLSYLRSSRPLLDTSQALTLRDLIEMCVDVSKGCCYLEEQHFVHRDLACRNCLVSSADPSARVVKIGDFGLARDIYKNDYYRKEGEGLLPVRWMAPESLVDGVFTSQSDVWAFGVLMWEIMTLGQQPYPARTNLEVLHYVRNGGRLHRPNNCPEDLHQLMLKCWSYNPECRPTFKYCLEILEKLKQHIIINALQLNSVESMNGTLRRLDDSTSRIEETTILPSSELRNDTSIESNPSEIPKYLELVYVSEDEMEPITSTDGYEVPRSSLRSNKSNNNNNNNIPQVPAQLNRKRPLSANSSLQRNNSTGRFQPPRVMRSNSTISNRSKSINMIRRGSFNSSSITRSSSFIRPKSISPSSTSATSVNVSVSSSTNGGSSLSNGIIMNGNPLRNGNSDITSELLLPQQNMKFCTYSNIAQAQKPLLTEITNLTTNVSNDARHGNRRSLNSHSIC